MRILLNREEAQVEEGATIAAVVEEKALPARSVIVAVNDDVVEREQWPTHELQEGDSVEIVRAVSGGDHTMTSNDTLTIAGREFTSRLFLGTGKYADDTMMMAALQASGTELVTVAVRYMKLDGSEQNTNILDLLSEARMHLLPNTAGAYTVQDALKMARLAKAATGTDWIKLEVIGDQASLWPDVTATVEATRILVDEGFVVLPYTSPDVVIARQLEEAGAATVMPLASPIGSGQGMQDWGSIQRIKEAVSVPVVVDAGIGAPSDAAIAMELGADAVLVNTAVAKATNPPVMAEAMKHGTIAGRLGYLAGRMPRQQHAQPSSPTGGVPTALASATNGRR
ncbi:MAG TPA: sulfur carrier protein ThiS [Thermomicrobiales bacterium]|nr:sulfur carrier protein ThiS [Thermomicrobiales bacterium]